MSEKPEKKIHHIREYKGGLFVCALCGRTTDIEEYKECDSLLKLIETSSNNVANKIMETGLYSLINTLMSVSGQTATIEMGSGEQVTRPSKHTVQSYSESTKVIYIFKLL